MGPRARWTGAWRAAHGVRCSWLAEARIVPVWSWHQVHTDEAAAAALPPVKAAGLIPEEEGRRCVMADGARWIWTPAQALVPSAGERLADEQGRAHLHQVATLPYGAPPEPHRAWGEAALTRLCWGEVPGVSGGLPRMKPTDAQAAEESTTLMGDLPRQQERRDERVARQGGYPMGSGGIESANTFICPVRLKRSGAWWDWDACQPEARPTVREISRYLRPGL